MDEETKPKPTDEPMPGLSDMTPDESNEDMWRR